MTPKFVKLHELKIVGVYGKFISVMSPDKNNMVVIPQLWQAYMPNKHKIKNAVSKVDLGVCFQIPEHEKSHPQECAYIAGTEVSSFEDIPEGMRSFVVAAGEYAVFTHVGGLDTFEATMAHIFGSWLPTSGKKMRMDPDLEWYDQRFKLNSPDSEIDIYIPIE